MISIAGPRLIHAGSVKWLHLIGEVSLADQTLQKLLKSVNFRRSYSKITSCKAKSGCSPPGHPCRRLLISVDSSVNSLACVHAAFALLVFGDIA